MSSSWRRILSLRAKILPSNFLILIISIKIVSGFLFSLTALLVGKPEMETEFQAADLGKEIVPGQAV